MARRGVNNISIKRGGGAWRRMTLASSKRDNHQRRKSISMAWRRRQYHQRWRKRNAGAVT